MVGTKGRNWFGLFAGVRKRLFRAQIATELSALIHGSLLSIFGFAVSFAGKKGSFPSRSACSGIRKD